MNPSNIILILILIPIIYYILNIIYVGLNGNEHVHSEACRMELFSLSIVLSNVSFFTATGSVAFVKSLFLCKVRKPRVHAKDKPTRGSLAEISWQPSTDFCKIWVFHEISDGDFLAKAL